MQQTETTPEDEIERLGALIAKLEKSPDAQLLIEHLQTADAYLQGGMPEECAHNLELAEQASATLRNAGLAAEINEIKRGIAAALDKAQANPALRRLARLPRPSGGASLPETAEGLEQFFHGTDVTFGIFYPKKHIVGVFHAFEQAQAGLRALEAAGLREWETIAIPGKEVVRFLERLHANHALWSTLMTDLSRALDTEASLVDSYTRWAQHGAGFVVAYAPSKEDAEEICELLRPSVPVAVDWFMPTYIRRLL